jgi:PHS family inorganic phosphate transporter-like MFS transporter
MATAPLLVLPPTPQNHAHAHCFPTAPAVIYDVAFYGINVFTPDILAAAFPGGDTKALLWQSLVVSLCGIPACVLAIYTFRAIGGRLLNFYGFLLNAASFILIGVLFYVTPPLPKGSHAPASPDSMAYGKFAALCLLTFSLNWGPNLATYVCPVQAFPPEVRGTFHGLSAAAGKLGAAVGAFLYPVMNTGIGKYGVAAVFFLQVGVNLAGAALAWYYIPARAAKKEGEEGLLATNFIN